MKRDPRRILAVATHLGEHCGCATGGPYVPWKLLVCPSCSRSPKSSVHVDADIYQHLGDLGPLRFEIRHQHPTCDVCGVSWCSEGRPLSAVWRRTADGAGIELFPDDNPLLVMCHYCLAPSMEKRVEVVRRIERYGAYACSACLVSLREYGEPYRCSANVTCDTCGREMLQPFLCPETPICLHCTRSLVPQCVLVNF